MIDDEVLRPRIPKLGTVTVGYGTTATSQAGKDYSQPARSKTFVFHTDDRVAADAVQQQYGGEIREDSPTWAFDVVTARREIDIVALPSMFRQSLEQWRRGQCAARCDGVQMSMKDGASVDLPCECNPQQAAGVELSCDPVTVLPAIVDLGVDRFGVWEVKSTSWGTASNLKGFMQALALVGADVGSVPAVARTVDRTLRDRTNQIREVTEITVTIAASHARLTELASGASALGGPLPAALPSGADAERLALMERWAEIQTRAHQLGLRNALADDWKQMFPGVAGFDDLSVDDLASWIAIAGATVADSEPSRANAPRSSESVGDGPGDTGTRDPQPAGQDGAVAATTQAATAAAPGDDGW